MCALVGSIDSFLFFFLKCDLSVSHTFSMSRSGICLIVNSLGLILILFVSEYVFGLNQSV